MRTVARAAVFAGLAACLDALGLQRLGHGRSDFRRHNAMRRVVGASDTPVALCVDGLRSGDGVCCAASCGRCGGTGCESLPGGAASCCRTRIRSSGTQCADAADTACILPADIACFDLIGKYTCANLQSASQTSESSLGACHARCRSDAQCSGGEFHASPSDASAPGTCHLFGVTGSQAQSCNSAASTSTLEATVFACQQPGELVFSFKALKVEYAQVVANQQLEQNLRDRLSAAIATEGGNSLTNDNVVLDLSSDTKGFLAVRVVVKGFAGDQARAIETAFSNVASLQVRLADAFASITDLAQATPQGTFEIAEISSPSATLPVDLPSVVARFGSLQQQIDELDAELLSVEQLIDTVGSSALSTKQSVDASLSTLTATVGTAERNQLLAEALKKQTSNAAARVAEATAEIKHVQGVISRMEETTETMEGQSQNITSRLKDLQYQAALLLPSGPGGFLERLAADEKQLQKQQQEAQDTAALDASVSASLRSNFRRSTAVVQNLTVDLQDKVDAEAMSDPPSDSPDNAATMLQSQGGSGAPGEGDPEGLDGSE